MPSYCDHQFSIRYGDYRTAEAREAAECDLYECEDLHCAHCFPDGPIDAGCDCDDCCYEEHQDVGEVWPTTIHSYGHKPRPTFWTSGGFSCTRLRGPEGERTTFLGCEVEVEVEHGADYYGLSRTFSEHGEMVERLYCKSDSSLDNGVELVSHPMTLRAWQELGKAGDLDFYAKLEQNGCYVGHTTGMHVHVNRSSFASDSHMARFGNLFVRNPGPMQELAGRSNRSYASFERFQVCKAVRGLAYGPRGAVNLGNSATIEIRMFASTLAPARILGNLECVHAAQAFTRGKAGKVADRLTFASFAGYVLDRADQYPHLAIRREIREGV